MVIDPPHTPECLVEERQFFIVCPRDVVVAKPRSADDRMEWLLQHERFAEALEVCGCVSQLVDQSVGQFSVQFVLSFIVL